MGTLEDKAALVTGAATFVTPGAQARVMLLEPSSGELRFHHDLGDT